MPPTPRPSEHLRPLESTLEQLWSTLEALTELTPIPLDEALPLLEAAQARVLEYRQAVEALASRLGTPFHPPTTRQGWFDLAEALEQDAVRQDQQHRQRLLELHTTLASGTLRHRLDRRTQQLEALRLAAVEEVRRVSEQEPPLPLPGPTEGSTWLHWAWHVQDPTLSTLLDALTDALAALRTLLIEASWQEWAGSGSSTLAPAALTRVQPPVSSALDATPKAGKPLTTPKGKKAVKTVHRVSSQQKDASTPAPPPDTHAEALNAGTVPPRPEPPGTSSPAQKTLEAPVLAQADATGMGAAGSPDVPETSTRSAASPVSAPPQPAVAKEKSRLASVAASGLTQAHPPAIPVSKAKPVLQEQDLVPVRSSTPLSLGSRVVARSSVPDRVSKLTSPQRDVLDSRALTSAKGSTKTAGAFDHLDLDALSEDANLDFTEAPPSFAVFCKQYYLDGFGQVVPGPWRETKTFERFVRQALPARLERMVQSASPLCLLGPWVLELALESLELPPWVGAAELEQASALWLNPDGASPHSEGWIDWLCQEDVLLDPKQQPRLQLRLVLELLRPGANVAQLARSSTDLLEAAGFQSAPLNGLIESLLLHLSRGQDPSPLCRRHQERGESHTPEKVADGLAQARAHYQKLVQKLWSAAGGQIKHTHCRKAWDQFVLEYQAQLKRFYPEAQGGDASWNPLLEERRLRDLAKGHSKIADANQALHDDRKKMDRSVQQIIEEGLRVNRCMRELQELQPQSAERTVAAQTLLGALEALKAGLPSGLPPMEVLCIRLLLRVLALHPAGTVPDPLALQASQLFESPSLIQVFPTSTYKALTAAYDPGAVIAPQAELDKMRACEAASLILWPGVPQVEPDPALSMGATLHRALQNRPGKGLRVLILEPGEKDLVESHKTKEAVQKLIYTIRAELEEFLPGLDALAISREPITRAFVELDELEKRRPGPDRGHLLRNWTGRLQAWMLHLSTQTLRTIQDQIRETQDIELIEAVRRLIMAKNYEGLRALQAGMKPKPGRPSAHAESRETMTRARAADRFSEPIKALDKVGHELTKTWLGGLVGDGRKDRKLRNDFIRYVIPERLLKLKGSDTPELPLVLETLHLRRWLDDEGLNPSWLPQLGLFSELVVLSPESRPTQRQFIHEVGSLARTRQHALCIVLAPRLTRELRQACLLELHKRRARGVIVDDLDLLRLFQAPHGAPNPLLGLLELALEQQSLESVSPFETHDGQHVKPEMYVGRRQEVEELVKKPRYSRLFSGRKLGKSALLRFIHHTWDGKALPSKNLLRVLFIQAVGAEKEADLVSRIVDEMKRTLDFKTGGVTHPDDPGDNLVQVMRRFKQENPRTSLLIILDEADTFVESQLSEFDQRQEQCLSFRMRSEIEGDKDEQGLPRVRFVFAGYRVTHRQEGAWANWGEVLRLVPLPAEEATALLEGPLARLSIDASEQAPNIAQRCGFQPAVILRFGAELVKHLQQRSPYGQRDEQKVTAEDVTQVFGQAAIQEEIRTITRNNFQGNELGKVVFSALLLELSALATTSPGQPLALAASRIVERLSELATRPGVDLKIPETLLNEATVHLALRDMADRELLVIQRFNGQEVHALKFAHHLPVLVTPHLEALLQDDLKRLSQAAPQLEKVHALLSAPLMLDLLGAITSERSPEVYFQAAVVAGHWPEALTHRAGGVPARLGILPSSTIPAANGHLREKLEQRDRVAIIGLSAKGLADVLTLRPASLPAPLLVGGIDLLRETLRRELEGSELEGSERASTELFELAPFARLSEPALWWWFHRIRGMEFESVNAIPRILELSSGIPFLVELLDRTLTHLVGEAASVSSAQLAQLEDTFQRELPAHLELLRLGEASVRLTDRELELLLMVAQAARMVLHEGELRSLLIDDWSARGRSELDVPGLDPQGDLLPLRVLQDSGLLPIRLRTSRREPLERLRLPEPGDALFRIAALLKR